ncbi:competence protein CoiA [Simiduia sp. 21SJ11W-1]|uniref:competence protein CoiA family protein n=1 Tax=Simiduia sp. 21SJ11W-1 TaxID=2909669 RepID=UPI0020A1C34A|nr:competence protein CoiA family protein [Simiduia sp. 21SJ11W-1]UTA49446.1 competence protein CoiA [Simiduia sp. 21SJ11W-1]
MSKAIMAWGLHRNGEYTHVSDALNGLKCECVCIDCEAPVVAHQGQKKAWHFVHASNTACQGESVLHKVAKKVLLRAQVDQLKIALPNLHQEITENDLMQEPLVVTMGHSDLEEPVEFAEEEVPLPKSLIADAVIQTKIYKELAVEIHVTNPKSEDDIQKYVALELPCIEIDLSEMSWEFTWAEIERWVLRSAPRKWLNKPKIDMAYAGPALRAKVETRNALLREKAAKLIEKLEDTLLLKRVSQCKLTGHCSQDNSEISEVIRVTALNGDWVKNEELWQAKGLVNDKTEVPIVIRAPWVPNPITDVDQLQLEILPRLSDTESDPKYSFKVNWFGIECWQAELTRRAEKIFVDKVDARHSLLRERVGKLIDRLDDPSLLQKLSQYQLTGYCAQDEPQISEEINITTLVTDWEKLDGLWKAKGLVNNKTEVPIVVRAPWVRNPITDLDQPQLEIVPLISETDGYLQYPYKASWLGIERWQSELARRAEKVFAEKRAAEASFKSTFKRSNQNRKIELIANDLGLPPPHQLGNFKKCWNACEAMWAGLIWRNSILKSVGGSVTPVKLSQIACIQELLEWPTDADSLKSRRIDLWCWLSRLEVAGLATHEGRQVFSIAKTIPPAFNPWKLPPYKPRQKGT